MAITGSGTSGDPYVLYTLADLESIGTSPYTLDKYYKLNNDIDASATADPGYNSGAGWLPIGTFTGNFNGDGHVITGLYINRSATNYVGFISIINGGTVTGLTIRNGTIIGGQYTGAVVGGNSTSSTVIITNCVNDNTTVTGTACVGGILGGSSSDRAALATITGNSSSGTITGTSNVGGILGIIRHFNLTLSNNTVTGEINNSGDYTGGIAGAINRGTVQYNEMNGSFGTLAHYVGGILGWLTSYTVTLTYNSVTCDIPAAGYDYIGGIVGILVEGSYTLTFNNNSYEGDISGRNYVGGLAGSNGNYDYLNSYIMDCTVKGSLTATGSQIGGVYGSGRGSVKNITLNSEEFTITVANTSDYVGGILGYSMWSQYIENCQVNVSITGARDYIGGIVGGSNSSTGHIINITDCQVEADIGGRNGIGGITGQCDTYGTTGITLNGCSYKGTITSTGDSCGGLVARNRVVTLTGSPSLVEAHINGNVNVGGAFGFLWLAKSPDCSFIQFKNTVVNGTGNSIGGIVGQLHRGAGLENADLNGTDISVNGSVNSDYVGGIFGQQVYSYHNPQLIKNCRVTGVEVTGRDYIGGIGGNIGPYGTIQRCNAIMVDVNGRDRVGGLIGSADSNAVITVSYSTGQVTGTGTHHGGLIGYFNATGGFSNNFSHCQVAGVTNVGGLIGYCGQNISTCYSKGLVTGTTAVGGLIGYIPGSQTATDCFWDTQTSGQANSVLGTGKTTAEMKTQGTFTNWDFNTPVWAIDSNWEQGYPYLAGYGVPTYLAGTIEATSSVSGILTVTKPYTLLSGAVEGQSSLEGDLRVWHQITLPGGTVAAEGDLSGNLRLLTLEPLAGVVEATSDVAGNLRLLRGAAKLSDELTIAVLGPDETLLRFLNPDVLEVEETHELGGLRTIEITHSLLDDLGFSLGEYADLLIHGNKLWRQFTGDGDSCLYVINEDREVDPEENSITVSADEVAAELSDLPPVRFNMSSPTMVTAEFLATYVGALFTPGEIETGQSFSYTGTIGVMGLLREIEEQTGFEFKFRYEFNTSLGVVERFLDFVELRGTVHHTPIEIGYNTANILLEESEADVAIAAAPLGSPRDSKDEANAAFHQARKAFEDLVVSTNTPIPLWVTKDESGEPQNGPLAYPPYNKGAGQTYVAAPPADSGASYKEVAKMAGLTGKVPRTVLFESSEENPYNLYWLCVGKIREKLQPQVKLETEMINMGRMAANDPTVYNVGDRVALQLPGRSERVLARIQKTVKNPREFDKDKVELGNYGIDFFTDYLDIGGSGKQPFEEL